MPIWRTYLFLAVLSLHWAATSPQLHEHHNITEWARSRGKRHLIFNNVGVQKFVISMTQQVPTDDKRVWRTLFGSWAFQWQHTLPTTVLYWWNSTFYPAKARSFGGAVLPTAPKEEIVDLTATFLYAVVENFMTNGGVNGRECLQRSICENAQVDLIGGLLDRIYRRFLTPEKGMDQFYKDAFAVGQKGADCFRTYPSCPRGASFFDSFVHIRELD